MLIGFEKLWLFEGACEPGCLPECSGVSLPPSLRLLETSWSSMEQLSPFALLLSDIGRDHCAGLSIKPILGEKEEGASE